MILAFQYLRAVAACLVVVFHLKTQVHRLGYQGYWPDWAFIGVDLFFVLSGYLMWAITAKRHQSARQFLLRRIARVVPLYWIVTSVVVGVMVVAPQLMMTGRFIPSHVIGSYLFIGMPNSSGWLYPVVNVGWTLNLEMLFYIIFAVCLRLPNSWRLTAIASVFSAIIASGYIFPKENIWSNQYTSSVLYEFVFGIVIAQRRQTGRLDRVKRSIAWGLIVGGFIWFVIANPSDHANFRAVFIGLPSAAIVTGFLMLEARARSNPHRWLLKLGNSSYSLYLTHLIVQSLVYQVWRKVGGNAIPGGVWVFIPLAILCCIAVSEIFYEYLERPLTQFFKNAAAHSAANVVTRS